jgi:hypothetical protein
MRRGQMTVSTRAAMVFYFLQHLDLDLDDLPPGRRQIVLVNKEEIDAAVHRARAATEERLNASQAR